MYEAKVIIEAVKEPVTKDYVKLHSKVVSGFVEDELLDVYIGTARRFFEKATGRTVHQKTYQMAYDEWPDDPFVLPFASPLIGVDSIIYTDSAGAPLTLASNQYAVDTFSLPGRIARGYSVEWPTFTPYPLSPIVIQYKAGIPTAVSPAIQAEAPADVKHCVTLLVGHYYSYREALIFNDRGIIVTNQVVDLGARSIIAQNIDWRFQ